MKKPCLAPLGCALLLAFAAPAQAWTVKDASNNTQLQLTDDGNLGVGEKHPGARLDVAGQVKITGGSPGAGKVLTSDADGLASWQIAAAGGECLLPTGYVKQGGLTWSPTGDRGAPWALANTYCAGAIGGQTGWRLPTKAELLALYSSGAVATVSGWTFGATWTSNVGGIPDTHWDVNMNNGYAWSHMDSSYYYVTCVR